MPALAVGLFVAHTHIPIGFMFNSLFFAHSCCFCSFPFLFFFACCWSSEQWVARKYKLYNYMTLWRQRRLHFKHEACAYLLPLIYFYNSFFIPNRCWVRFRCCEIVYIFFHNYFVCAASSLLQPHISGTVSRFHQFHSVVSKCVHFISFFFSLGSCVIRFLYARAADTFSGN